MNAEVAHLNLAQWLEEGTIKAFHISITWFFQTALITIQNCTEQVFCFSAARISAVSSNGHQFNHVLRRSMLWR
jgi:hypothetical protein